MTYHINFHCLLLALCDNGCSGVLNCVHAWRLHVLPFLKNFAILERCHTQLKNVIMNNYQGDHVTFVWTWRRRKQRLSFVAHFMNLFNTAMLMPYTDICSETLMSHFWYRRVGLGCQALNFWWQSSFVFKMSRMNACLQNVLHSYSPSLIGWWNVLETKFYNQLGTNTLSHIYITYIANLFFCQWYFHTLWQFAQKIGGNFNK